MIVCPCWTSAPSPCSKIWTCRSVGADSLGKVRVGLSPKEPLAAGRGFVMKTKSNAGRDSSFLRPGRDAPRLVLGALRYLLRMPYATFCGHLTLPFATALRYLLQVSRQRLSREIHQFERSQYPDRAPKFQHHDGAAFGNFFLPHRYGFMYAHQRQRRA